MDPLLNAVSFERQLPLVPELWATMILPRMTPLLSIMAWAATCHEAHALATYGMVHEVLAIEMFRDVVKKPPTTAAATFEKIGWLGVARGLYITPTATEQWRSMAAQITTVRWWREMPFAQATPNFIAWVPWWWRIRLGMYGAADDLNKTLHISNTARSDEDCRRMLVSLVAHTAFPAETRGQFTMLPPPHREWMPGTGQVLLSGRASLLADYYLPPGDDTALKYALASGELPMVEVIERHLEITEHTWIEDSVYPPVGFIQPSPALVDVLAPVLIDEYLRTGDLRVIQHIRADRFVPVFQQLRQHPALRSFFQQWPVCALVAEELLVRPSIPVNAAVWWWQEVMIPSEGARDDMVDFLETCDWTLTCAGHRGLEFLVTHGLDPCGTSGAGGTPLRRRKNLAEHLLIHLLVEYAGNRLKYHDAQLFYAVQKMTRYNCYGGRVDAFREAIDMMARGEIPPHERPSS